MAGRRHHYIQQHLSRGFGVDPTRRPAQVWVYRRGIDPFNVATEKYGAERDFYGTPTDTAVDEAITEMEADVFNPLIDTLRSEPDLSIIDPNLAARFVQHLLFRSKHLRSVFSAAVSEITRTAVAHLLRPDALKPFLRELIGRHTGKLVAKVEQECSRTLSPQERQMVSAFIESNGAALVDEFLRSQWPQLEQTIRSFINLVPAMVGVGHQKALRNKVDDMSGPREEALRLLRWTVHDSSLPLVLGDSVAFSELSSGEFAPLPDKKMEVTRVLVPVATRRFLMGSCDQNPPGSDRVVHGAVVCSFDSFCAAFNSPELRGRQADIGISSMPVSPTELQQIAMDSLGEALQRQLVEGFK